MDKIVLGNAFRPWTDVSSEGVIKRRYTTNNEAHTFHMLMDISHII